MNRNREGVTLPALPTGDPVRCLECRHLRYVRQSDRSTWACPNCATAPATGQRFTVDPRGARGFGRRNTVRIDR